MNSRLLRVIRLLTFLAFCLPGLHIEAQMIRRLSYADGLPSSSVMSVLSASDGFLWIGTIDGLAIYDGHTIHPFNQHFAPAQLSGNLIHSLHETKDAIWIQTNYGLDRLAKSDGHIDEFPDFRENHTYISEDNEVMFTVGVANQLYYYIEGTSSSFRPIEGISVPPSGFTTISCKGDTLRIFERKGIRSYLLERKKSGVITLSKQLSGVQMDIVRSFPDYDGSMWIVDAEGMVWLFNSRSGKSLKYADMSEYVRTRGPIFSIARHRGSDEVFVGFQWNGVVKLHASAPGAQPAIYPLDINSGVGRILPDSNQQVMWITTDGEGVYEYIESEVSIHSLTYSDLNHRIHRPVRALWADDEGSLWIGTKGDGILRIRNYNPSTHTGPITPDMLDQISSPVLHKEVYSFSPSRRPILWIGTAAGINYYSYSDRQVRTLPFPDGSYPQHIHSIYEESADVLWVASSGQGIFRIQLSGAGDSPTVIGVREYSHDNGNWALNFFFAIHPGKGGVMYGVNRGYGAVEIKNEEMKMLPLHNNYSTRMVNDMFAMETQGDTIWYGTGAGVIRKIGNEETLFGKRAGMLSPTVHAMVLTPERDLWISTNNGLACINTASGRLRTYSHASGVEVNEFSDGAFCRRARDIYFGGVDGIVVVSNRPNKSPSTVDYSPILFTSLVINGERHSLHSQMSAKRVSIGSDESNFSIELAAPDHINGIHYSFQYRLSKDKEWNDVENQRIKFSYLPYGSYTLMARYIDAATGFVSQPYTIDIEMRAPWYLSWWARLIYILLILAALGATVWYILQRQKREQQLKIKELKREQKDKMYENKLRFFTSITHEFNAPLTLIYGPCEQILNHSGVDSYTVRYVNLIRHNAERLNSLIQEIIDFGRVESGVMPRVVTEVNVSKLCIDTLQLFASLEEQYSVQLKRDIEPDIVWPTDLRSITKILYNLISNAFKYTPSYGTIKVTLHTENDSLQLRVYNTGKGIEEKDRKRIFDRYTIFDNMEENATKGLSSRHGLGMATCHAMVELLEGDIHIESEIGKYAEFIVTLPPLPLSSSIAKDVLSESLPIASPELTELHKHELEEVKEIQPLEVKKPERPKQKTDKRNSILLIDDDAEILHLLHDAMAQLEVYTATNAQEGLAIVTEKSPDIIITDIMMAGEGGIWFTKKVKENRHTAHIPIIMLSAKSTSVDKITGLKAGADAYVAKPFSTEYLLEMVKRMLSSRGELKEYYNSSASAFEYVDGQILNQPDKDFINRLKDVVEESIADSELTADTLAGKMNMSTRNFYRKMKDMQLPPPIDFIRQHRIKHAAKLLATTSIPIQEVVYRSGFNNRSYFYKEFDKVYGMTPKNYRMQQQKGLNDTEKV